MNLTSEQKKALELDRHLVVTANAGSGKTKVLVDRYLKIVENLSEELSPQNILAITFTEQAAAEMKQRVIKNIDEKITELGDTTIDLKLKKKYNKLKRQLVYANILTTHSFCLNILRDYPQEANLPPNFTALDDYKQNLILNTAVSNAINTYLEAQNSLEFGDLNFKIEEQIRQKLFVDYKYKFIYDIIVKLLYKRDIWKELKSIYDKTEEEYVQQIREEVHRLQNKTFSDFQEALRQIDIEECEIEYKKKHKGKYKIPNKVKETILEICEAENYQVEGIEQKVIDVYAEKKGASYLLNDLWNTSGIKQLVLNGATFSPDAKYRNALLEQLEKFDDKSVRMQFQLAREVFNIAQLADFYSMEEKRKIGGIDFDDMLILARNLLDNPEIAKSVANNYTHILIDEFQDTNAIQYDIVKSLALREDMPIEQQPYLFIVGDDKQSIYRFRNADVSIFNKAREEIKEKNKERKLKKNRELTSEEEVLGSLNLTTTFRLTPIIAAFVNKVCGKNFAKYENNEDGSIKYTDLVCGRKEHIDLALKDDLTSEEKKKLGEVKFLLTTTSGESDDENVNEAEQVANYVKSLLNEGNKPQDIAILYRARTKVPELVYQFLKNGISYKIISGGGFYSQQEVYDLINYLKFVNDRTNDLALVAVLRSPFFNISNDEFCEIFMEKGDNLWEKLQENNKKNGTSNCKINFAVEELSNALSLAPVVSISHLLRILLRSGNWLTYLKKDKVNATKITQNIEKFVEIARDFQERDFVSYADFIRELDRLIEISNEAEAEEEGNEEAVKLLTIHSSKGKEFPIVILYSLNQRSANVSAPFVDKKNGISFSAQLNEAGLGSEKITNLVAKISKKYEQQAEDEELQRLIYVATTRAERQLVISGTVKKTKEGWQKLNPAFSFFFDGLEWEIGGLIELCEKKPQWKQTVELELKLLGHESKKINEEIEIIFNDNNDNVKENYQEEHIKIDENNVQVYFNDDVIYSETGKIFSFSSLTRCDNMLNNIYETAADEFFKNKIGLHKLSSDYFLDEKTFLPTGDVELSAIDKGNLYHKVFEQLRSWFINESVCQENLRKIVDEVSYELNCELSDKLKNEVIQNCKKTVEIDFVNEILRHNLADAKFEYDLTLAIDDNFVTGALDCLIKNLDGKYEVWDWKTNVIYSQEKIDNMKKIYELQAEIYSCFLMSLFPEQEEYAVKLFLIDNIDKNEKVENCLIEYKFHYSEKQNIEDMIKEKIDNAIVKIRI